MDMDTLAFLSFEDWRAKAEHMSSDWVVVARSWRNESEDLFTFSALADGDWKTILETHEWDVRVEFGTARSYLFPAGESFYRYDPHKRLETDGVYFMPFTIHRTFHGYVPRRFELAQDFILYHEAFFWDETGEYRRRDENGDLHIVARPREEGENVIVEVDADHLRDYLAARGCFLVRHHDHRRWSEEDITERIGGEFVVRGLADERRRFELWLRTDIPSDDQKSSSSLLGKDVVLPYSRPRMWQHLFANGEEEFATFIVGRDDQGNAIELTCNERELSNYCSGLIPVFFRPEVLKKYYDEPSRYRASEQHVSCQGLWDLPIDITDENLVQVWLKDLGRIPYREQLHWRQFNVPPRGGITQHRFRQDFLAEFVEPPSPVYQFRVAFGKVQKAAQARYGKDLFLPLRREDAHVLETLHVPVTDEWVEFDQQVLALAKVTVDSLNVQLLARQTGCEIGEKVLGKDINGSLDLFEVFLDSLTVEPEVREKIVQGLRSVQRLRSAGAAHRKGGRFDQVLKDLELDGLPKREMFQKLLEGVTSALTLLAEVLESEA